MMMLKPLNNKNRLFILLAVSFFVRCILAGFTELGNDEVYYRLYALYPDWSHFDHPPMVGWIIQLFSLNLLFQNEFFLRLGAVVLGTASTFLIYKIGCYIKDESTGWYAALLFTASIYCFVIAGTFIMPDSPQVFFWLLTLFFLLKSLPDKNLSKESRRNLLLAGVTAGLALLSKYHSVFLLSGGAVYVLLFNRRWLRAKELYLSFIIACLFFIPVMIWNAENNFISFTFHEARVENHSGIRWDYIGTEVIGQIFYNNPVNFILIIISLFWLIKKNDFLRKDYAALLLSISVPLSIVFLAFSFSNATLPHWTGPAYLGYILIAASFIAVGKKGMRKALTAAVILPAFVLPVAFIQINTGILPLKPSSDPTSQLYGYRQLGEKFRMISKKAESEGEMMEDSPIVTTRWFPAANFDLYVASPLNKKVYAIGDLERIHKYFWINKDNGELKKHSDAWYIGLSDGLNDPYTTFAPLYDSIVCRDTLIITRSGHFLRSAYIYRLYGKK